MRGQYRERGPKTKIRAGAAERTRPARAVAKPGTNRETDSREALARPFGLLGGCERVRACVGEIARMWGKMWSWWRVWRRDNTIRACGDVQVERLRASAPMGRQSHGEGEIARAGVVTGAGVAVRGVQAGAHGCALVVSHGAMTPSREPRGRGRRDRGGVGPAARAGRPAPCETPRWPAAAGIGKGDGGGGRESSIRPQPQFSRRFFCVVFWCVWWGRREEMLPRRFHGVD